MAVLEASKSKGSFLFMPFLNWFVPYFAAFSFPLARTSEYQADAISARLTSSRAIAEALTGVEVTDGYLNDFPPCVSVAAKCIRSTNPWPQVWRASFSLLVPREPWPRAAAR
jgi:hypothetical protein